MIVYVVTLEGGEWFCGHTEEVKGVFSDRVAAQRAIDRWTAYHPLRGGEEPEQYHIRSVEMDLYADDHGEAHADTPHESCIVCDDDAARRARQAIDDAIHQQRSAQMEREAEKVAAERVARSDAGRRQIAQLRSTIADDARDDHAMDTFAQAMTCYLDDTLSNRKRSRDALVRVLQMTRNSNNLRPHVADEMERAAAFLKTQDSLS